MLARIGLRSQTRPLRFNQSVRYNSTHHHADAHQVAVQGDGNARIYHQ
jgi:hypothetical protein